MLATSPTIPIISAIVGGRCDGIFIRYPDEIGVLRMFFSNFMSEDGRIHSKIIREAESEADLLPRSR
jgi:hypothetical protein